MGEFSCLLSCKQKHTCWAKAHWLFRQSLRTALVVFWLTLAGMWWNIWQLCSQNALIWKWLRENGLGLVFLLLWQFQHSRSKNTVLEFWVLVVNSEYHICDSKQSKCKIVHWIRTFLLKIFLVSSFDLALLWHFPAVQRELLTIV